MRRISRNLNHLYRLIKTYDTARELITWTQALKRYNQTRVQSNGPRINPQEFEVLSNLAAKAGYLVGMAYTRKRTKKYWREHRTLEPPDFSFFRTVSPKGREFLARFEAIQASVDEIYPEKIEGLVTPPEQVRFEIMSGIRRLEDGTEVIRVRFIPDNPNTLQGHS